MIRDDEHSWIFEEGDSLELPSYGAPSPVTSGNSVPNSFPYEFIL
jgi:hypothetical protein